MRKRFDRKNPSSSGLMVIQAWNRMLRLPNLVLIIFTQMLIYFCFIKANFIADELALNFTQSILFLLTLLFVASSGYVVNNIYDSEIDSLDSDKAIIPNYFTKKQSWQLYAALVLTGFLIAVYLSFKTHYYNSILLYPLAALSLWLYSIRLKCLPLIGNFLVSILTGSVIAIIPYIFWENFKELRISDYNTWASLMYRLIMLFLFAVLSNLTREIIKDIEDIELDKSHNCYSTANFLGSNSAKLIAINVWFALLIICSSSIWYASGMWPKIWSFLILGIPALSIFILLIKCEEQKDYTKLSLYIKLFMILGTFYWCLVEGGI